MPGKFYRNFISQMKRDENVILRTKGSIQTLKEIDLISRERN